MESARWTDNGRECENIDIECDMTPIQLPRTASMCMYMRSLLIINQEWSSVRDEMVATMNEGEGNANETIGGMQAVREGEGTLISKKSIW